MVLVQLVLRSRRVAALLAHVQLVAPLLVGVRLRDAVDLLHVGLQGAALRKGLLAQRALVGPHSCTVWCVCVWGGVREKALKPFPRAVCLERVCSRCNATHLCVCARAA